MSVPIAGISGYPVIFKTLLMVFLIAGLAGCGTFRNQMAPKQSFNTDKDIKELEKKFGNASSITEYYTGNPTSERRNKFITGRLVLINIHYIQFIRNFAANKAQLDTATDMLQLGVDLAITVVGGAAVKAALGAASAGITGTRTSISKNFFYEKTVPVLITAMNSQRKVALIPIITGIKKGTDKYPLAQAVSDLEQYYFAGTFVGALQAIQKNSAEKEADADKKILTITRAADFTKKDFQERVVALIAKVGKLSEADAINIARKPPVKDTTTDALVNRLVNPKFYTRKINPNPAAAKRAIRLRISRGKRSEAILKKWEKTLAGN